MSAPLLTSSFAAAQEDFLQSTIGDHPQATAMLIAALVVIIFVLAYMWYTSKPDTKSTFCTPSHGNGAYVAHISEHDGLGSKDRGDTFKAHMKRRKDHYGRKDGFTGSGTVSGGKCGAWDAEAIAEASALGPQGLGGLASDTSYGAMFDGWDTGSADTGDDGTVTKTNGVFNDAVADDDL